MHRQPVTRLDLDEHVKSGGTAALAAKIAVGKAVQAPALGKPSASKAVAKFEDDDDFEFAY